MNSVPNCVEDVIEQLHQMQKEKAGHLGVTEQSGISGNPAQQVEQRNAGNPENPDHPVPHGQPGHHEPQSGRQGPLGHLAGNPAHTGFQVQQESLWKPVIPGHPFQQLGRPGAHPAGNEVNGYPGHLGHYIPHIHSKNQVQSVNLGLPGNGQSGHQQHPGPPGHASSNEANRRHPGHPVQMGFVGHPGIGQSGGQAGHNGQQLQQYLQMISLNGFAPVPQQPMMPEMLMMAPEQADYFKARAQMAAAVSQATQFLENPHHQPLPNPSLQMNVGETRRRKRPNQEQLMYADAPSVHGNCQKIARQEQLAARQHAKMVNKASKNGQQGLLNGSSMGSAPNQLPIDQLQFAQLMASVQNGVLPNVAAALLNRTVTSSVEGPQLVQNSQEAVQFPHSSDGQQQETESSDNIVNPEQPTKSPEVVNMETSSQQNEDVILPTDPGSPSTSEDAKRLLFANLSKLGQEKTLESFVDLLREETAQELDSMRQDCNKYLEEANEEVRKFVKERDEWRIYAEEKMENAKKSLEAAQSSEANYEASKMENEELRQKNEVIVQEKGALEGQIDRLTSKMEEMASAAEQDKKLLAEATQKVEEKDGEMEVLKDGAKKKEEELETRKMENEGLRQKNEAIVREKEASEAKLASLTSKMDDIVAAANNDKKLLEEANRKIQEKDREMDVMKNDARRKDEELETGKMENEGLRQKNEVILVEKGDLEGKVRSLTTKMEEIGAAANNEKKLLEEANRKIQEKDREMEVLKEETRKKEEDLEIQVAAKETENKTLQEQLADLRNQAAITKEADKSEIERLTNENEEKEKRIAALTEEKVKVIDDMRIIAAEITAKYGKSPEEEQKKE